VTDIMSNNTGAKGAVLVAAATLLSSQLLSSTAHAEPVTATGKGIAGGVLLGAEVVMIPLGAAGVDKWWAYLLGGGLGAAGGAVGGYFVETKVSKAEPSLYMLAGGLALVIPAVVLTLNATAYKPEVEEGETISEEPGAGGDSGTPGAAPEAPESPGTAPPAAPGAPPPATPAPGKKSSRAKARRGHAFVMPAPGLLGLDFTGQRVALRPGTPTVEVKPMYSSREVAQYGVAQGTEVSFPAIVGRF
jgi:hypothetical protein